MVNPNFSFANPFVLEYQQKFKSFSVAPGVNTILPESMDSFPVQVLSFHVWYSLTAFVSAVNAKKVHQKSP